MARLALLAALALAAPAAVHGRAGGGGSYSSGSSHSSGSSYSSGSSHSSGGSYRSRSYTSSSGSYRSGTPSSAAEQAAFGFLFLALVVVLLLLRWFEGRTAFGSARSPAAAAGFAALRSADPAFDEAGFLARAQASFLMVQEAWSAGDMTPACGLLSDGVFERFQLLLDLQRREGRVNTLEDVRVRRAVAADASPGRRFDAVDVRIEASCKDRYVSVRDGSLLSEEDSSFVEYWSFLRSASARGRSSPGAVEGFCPGCGAALEVNASAACPQCRCWVNSGEFDWVLAEITQESEWDPGRTKVSALAVLAHDPEAAAQALEDRVSMLFWRWQRCLADGDAAALEGWCSEEGLAAVRASGVGRLRYEDCGVGSVELEAARAADGFEQVGVVVRWAGREGGPEAPSRKRRTTLTLSRKAGTHGAPNTALRSAHCSGCGAGIPPAGAACAHCGRGFKDPATDWVLTDLRTFDS